MTISHDEGQAGFRKRPLLLAVGAAAIAMATPFLPESMRVVAGAGLAVLVCGAALLLEQSRARGVVYAAGGAALFLQLVPAPDLDSFGGVVPVLGGAVVLALGAGWFEGIRRGGRERAIADKHRLLASISHQLRTPLTAVLGFAELLRSRDAVDEERRRMLEDMAAQAFELSARIDDLVVASRAELGHLDLASVPVDLRSNLAQELEVWDPDDRVAERVVVRGEAPTALGDPRRVRQILRNLLTNALRHGGGRVRVEFGMWNGQAVVTVADDGPGIPTEVVSAVFDPYQTATPESLPGPIGLGLTVARMLAQRMGGDIVHVRAEGWTEFRLRLPAAEVSLSR